MTGFRIAAVLLAAVAVAGCSSPPEPGPGVPPAESRPTRVLLLEGYPRWEYRYLKNALIRDEYLLVDTLLLSADPNFPQQGSPGRTPLGEAPLEKAELARYDVIILGDVPPQWLETINLSHNQCCENLARWVVEQGGGLILVAGGQSMPSQWKETALEPLFPVELETPLPEATGDYGFKLTDRGILSPITSLPHDPAPPAEAWEDRDGRGDGLRNVRWILATRCKPGAHALVESGPEDRRVPLFVTRETGRGRVFFAATDETWRWRFVCGDAPWFYPFWKRVIDWANGGE